MQPSPWVAFWTGSTDCRLTLSFSSIYTPSASPQHLHTQLLPTHATHATRAEWIFPICPRSCAINNFLQLPFRTAFIAAQSNPGEPNHKYHSFLGVFIFFVCIDTNTPHLFSEHLSFALAPDSWFVCSRKAFHHAQVHCFSVYRLIFTETFFILYLPDLFALNFFLLWTPSFPSILSDHVFIASPNLPFSEPDVYDTFQWIVLCTRKTTLCIVSVVTKFWRTQYTVPMRALTNGKSY